MPLMPLLLPLIRHAYADATLRHTLSLDAYADMIVYFRLRHDLFFRHDTMPYADVADQTYIASPLRCFFAAADDTLMFLRR